MKSFSRAIHLNPAEPELWEEDLCWACRLRNQRKEREKQQGMNDAIPAEQSLKRARPEKMTNETSGVESTSVSHTGKLTSEGPGMESTSVPESAELSNEVPGVESTPIPGTRTLTNKGPGEESTSVPDAANLSNQGPGVESTSHLSGLSCCRLAMEGKDGTAQDNAKPIESKVCSSHAIREDSLESNTKYADTPNNIHFREGYR